MTQIDNIDDEKPPRKPVYADVLERMQVWISCGRTKESFGEMTERESEVYDSIAADYERAKKNGHTMMIIHD